MASTLLAPRGGTLPVTVLFGAPVAPVPRTALVPSGLGGWRACAWAPAVVGSAGMLVFLFAFLGGWEALVLLGWLAVAVLLTTRPGERLAVRAACGFRSPDPGQRVLLEELALPVLARCGWRRSDVDLYVCRTGEANAYAAGGRSVAISEGLLSEIAAYGHLTMPAEAAEAVLAHEVGHLVTGGTRWLLAAGWLTAPWRKASGMLIGCVMATLGRLQPRRPMLLVAATGVVDAVVQCAQQRAWAGLLVLGAIIVVGLTTPPLDAWLSRRSEHAADTYARTIGYGPALADALEWLVCGPRGSGLLERLGSSHPKTSSRSTRLRLASPSAHGVSPAVSAGPDECRQARMTGRPGRALSTTPGQAEH